VYLMRTSRHLWQSRPSGWLLLASVLDVVAVSVLAVQGIFMAALDPALVAALLATVMVYLVLLDLIKVRLFRRLDLH